MTAYQAGHDEGRRFGFNLSNIDLQNTIDMYHEGQQDEYERGLLFGLEAEQGRRIAVHNAYYETTGGREVLFS